jgi:hypothetical protein
VEEKRYALMYIGLKSRQHLFCANAFYVSETRGIAMVIKLRKMRWAGYVVSMVIEIYRPTYTEV